MTDGEIERKILRHEIWIEKILNIQKKAGAGSSVILFFNLRYEAGIDHTYAKNRGGK